MQAIAGYMLEAVRARLTVGAGKDHEVEGLVDMGPEALMADRRLLGSWAMTVARIPLDGAD